MVVSHLLCELEHPCISVMVLHCTTVLAIATGLEAATAAATTSKLKLTS